jgi:hypothetical protein
MSESERLQRFKERCGYSENTEDANEWDEKTADRIRLLLNDPKIIKYCMVDADYYDFSVIPRGVQERLQLWRDAYLIYGVNLDGEIISKWVDRWDLDSSDPIVDGKCIHPPFDPNQSNSIPPEIMECFNPKLLSTPAPDILKLFGKNE